MVEGGKIWTQYLPEMLKNIDILVDGEFVEEKKDITLRFKGSSNQRIIDVQKSLKANQVVLSPFNEKKSNSIKPIEHNELAV